MTPAYPQTAYLAERLDVTHSVIPTKMFLRHSYWLEQSVRAFLESCWDPAIVTAIHLQNITSFRHHLISHRWCRGNEIEIVFALQELECLHVQHVEEAAAETVACVELSGS